MGLTDREYYRDEQAGWQVGSGRSMVFTLIVVNVAVLIADMLFGGSRHQIAGWLSLMPSDLWHPWLWWRFLSYGFVHDPNAVGHIVLNMFMLYMFGRQVEGYCGSPRFLRFYLTAVVLCGLLWAVRQAAMYGSHPGIQLMGASGAVTATFVLYVCLYPRSTILLFFFMPVPAWLVGLLFVLADTASFLSEGGSDWGQVAFDVHLVGAAFGGLYFLYLRGGGIGLPDLQLSRWWRRWWRPRLRIRRDEPFDNGPDEEMERRADALLEKVGKYGIDSLTASERRFLEQYSRQVRARSFGPR